MLTYTYMPEKIAEYGKDQMRFELGDVMVEGGAETTALSDQEIEAILSCYTSHIQKKWKHAKLKLLESICRRFSYEVTEKIGPLSQNLGERAILWRKDYEELKKELKNSSVPKINNSLNTCKEANGYFYHGMMKNPELDGRTF